MELTQKKIDEIMNTLLAKAKKVREGIPYSKDEMFAQSVLFLGPNMEVATYPVTWRTEAEKYAKFRALSIAAKETLSQAVIMIADVRSVNGKNAAKYLGLPSVEEIGLEAFGKLYKAEVMKRWGGDIGNAPHELFTEAIIVVMKGPGLNQIPIRSASYEEGPKDSIRWLPNHHDDKIGGVEHLNLLPDWWC